MSGLTKKATSRQTLNGNLKQKTSPVSKINLNKPKTSAKYNPVLN